MNETVLNNMDKKERKILETELQKVCMKKGRGRSSDSRGVEISKKIWLMLEENAGLEELKTFLKEKGLSADTYYLNGIPLAAHLYWYARSCGREDVCRWAIDMAVTIDGFLNVQKPEHQKRIAEKFTAWDEKEAYGYRKMFLHEEACWTDAPNLIAVILSGNVALFQAFAAAGNQDHSVRAEKNKIVPVKNAKKPYYVLRRNTSVEDFSIPNLLTAAILSGTPEMLEYYIVNYYYDCEFDMRDGEIAEVLGKAIAGTGRELSEYILKNHVELLNYVKIEQVLKAGNAQLLGYLLRAGKGDSTWKKLLFMNTRDLTVPYASAPGFPRGHGTDTEMYRAVLEWKNPDFTKDMVRDRIKEDLLKAPGIKFPDLHNEQEQKEKWGLYSREGFGVDYIVQGSGELPSVYLRKLELLGLYQELGGEATPEVQNAIPIKLSW